MKNHKTLTVLLAKCNRILIRLFSVNESACEDRSDAPGGVSGPIPSNRQNQYAPHSPESRQNAKSAAHSWRRRPLSALSGLPPMRASSRASTCSSQKPAAAASAIVAPNTTRSIFDQWIAERHIGHGSQVEYISHPLSVMLWSAFAALRMQLISA